MANQRIQGASNHPTCCPLSRMTWSVAIDTAISPNPTESIFPGFASRMYGGSSTNARVMRMAATPTGMLM